MGFMRHFLLVFLLPCLAFGLTFGLAFGLNSPNYTAKQLKTKDYEEMRSLVKQVILQARAKAPTEELLTGHEDAIEELKKGLILVLMRPDTDNVIEPLIVSLQSEIMNFRSFLPVFSEVIDSSTRQFGTGSLAEQASWLYVIENSLAYLQSLDDPVSIGIIKKIQDANLKISKKLASYLMMEMGRGKTASPSYLAKRILKAKEEEQKKQQLAKIKQQKALERDSAKKRGPSSDPDSADKKPVKIIPIDFTHIL